MNCAVLPQLSYILQRDIAAVTELEQQLFESPWARDELVERLRRPSALSMAARLARGGPIVGYVLWSLCVDVGCKTSEILRIGVAPEYRRQGIGAALLSAPLARLRRRPVAEDCRVQIAVTDRDLAVHLFLKNNGFVAERILPAHAADGSDSYMFVCRGKDSNHARHIRLNPGQ